MKYLYLFTLEIIPLEAGKVYDELPSHLTLMSRFLSDMSPEVLAATASPLFASTAPVRLVFAETLKLGPKQVTAHMVSSPNERQLHDGLRKLLDTAHAEYQFPEFIGDNHKPHVTERENVHFELGSEHIASAVYLIEVIDKQRMVRSKFELGEAQKFSSS